MPYIDQKGRDKFQFIISSIDSLKIDLKDLRYLMRLFVDYFIGNISDYITEDKFYFLKSLLNENSIDNNGELNYLITKTIKSYMDYHGEKYQNYDDVVNVIERVKYELSRYDSFRVPVGTLECCKLEIYRKWIVPYEEKKEKENGSI